MARVLALDFVSFYQDMTKLKFMFSRKATKIDEMSIWRYVGNVKSTVKIVSIFVAFSENMNFRKHFKIQPLINKVFLKIDCHIFFENVNLLISMRYILF